MVEAATLLLALLAGIILGGLFFGGLWWTVQRGVASPSPAVWFLGSFLLRMTVSLAGFYLVSRGDWRKLLACLLGFLIARLLVTRFTRVPLAASSRISEGVSR